MPKNLETRADSSTCGSNSAALPEDLFPSARRGFLKASCATVSSVLLGAAPGLLRGQTLTRALRVGLVGCGGRGTGAASQALMADPHAELIALGDVDQSQIQKCVATLGAIRKIAAQVNADRQFVGLDAYEKVIRSDVDVVLLATPPGFRPLHLAACVDAGKHIFCEKPVATDACGVRSVLQSAEKAKAKNLSLVGGLCWRYSPVTQRMFSSIHQGAIGGLMTYTANYFGNTVKPMPPPSARPAGMSDIEWQIRNWYNFVWLSGDGLVEQAIHSADRIAWAMHDAPPISCFGVGGRAVPAQGGNIYDHFAITYQYPNGVQAFLASRQIDNCYNDVSDYIVGSEGSCTFGRGPFPSFEGKSKWAWNNQMGSLADLLMNNSGSAGARVRSHVREDVYQYEQNVLMSSIRNQKPVNDGDRMATSTMLVILGRMAAYTGQQVTWAQAFGSNECLVPEKLEWNARLPVAPLAEPGFTRVS